MPTVSSGQTLNVSSGQTDTGDVVLLGGTQAAQLWLWRNVEHEGPPESEKPTESRLSKSR
jgi:hypothetical protein